MLLNGGLPREQMHLLQGAAGTGKTTLALQFVRDAARLQEPALYVTLSQSKAQLELIARSHGWTLDGIHVHEVSPQTVAQRLAERQTILPTSEVELVELFRELEELVRALSPRRAVIDSLSVLKLLTGTAQRYHHETVNLRQLFTAQGCTLLAIVDQPAEHANFQEPDVSVQPLSGCVIDLEQCPRTYGDARRRLRVVKTRGQPHNGGYHDIRIETGTFDVFPRLGAYTQVESRNYEPIASGIDSIDAILGGGLNTGTSCLIVGASGTGKSSVATLFARAAVIKGHRSAIYLFDERPQTYIERSEMTGTALRRHVESGDLLIRQLDPGTIAPGEFAQLIRHQVEQLDTKVVVLDSVVGYFAAMGAVDVLVTQLHELMTYLTRRDVLVILCGAQEGFMSIGAQLAVDVSYLSDTIIAISYYEDEADLRRAITVVKKKYGAHKTTIHDFTIRDGELHVSAEPLRQHRNLMLQRSSEPFGAH